MPRRGATAIFSVVREGGTRRFKACLDHPMHTLIRVIPFLFLLVCPFFLSGQDQSGQAVDSGGVPEVRMDPSALDRSNRERMTSYADVLEKATPAVVAVYTTQIVEQRSMARSGDPLEDILRFYYGLPPSGEAEPDDEPEERRVPSGVGSGVIVSENGYILTNNHVVTVRGREVDEIEVRLADGRRFEAGIVGRDPATDIAVLKVEAEAPLPSIVTTNSDDIRVGDVAFAIGNPLEVGLTVTQGIISATGRTNLGIIRGGGYEDFIQTDASINMGNSGGALVDAEGRLIGINTAIVSRSGGNIGIGFAIPVNMARNVMNSLITTGTVKRGFLGVVPGDLTPELADTFELPNLEGAILNRVESGLPAARAGLQHGDVIIGVDGEPITGADDLRLTISQTPPGTRVSIDYYREGELKTTEVTLGDLESGLTAMVPETPLEGVELTPLNDEVREQFNIPEAVEGLLVTAVERDSAFRDRLAPGTVIVEINKRPVTRPSEVEAAMKDRRNTAYIWYRNAYRFISLDG